MGVDRKGDMEYLLSMTKPIIAVVTNINRNFPDTGATLDDIAVELGHLAQIVSAGGSVILNGEDCRVKKLREKTKAKTVFYGTGDDCNAKISNIETVSAGQRFIFSYEGEQKSIEIEKHGRHNIDACVVAKIVSKELELIKKEKDNK